MKHPIFAILLLTPTLGFCADTDTRPLRVFILAGQSNMEGHAKVETFDYIGDDPATAPLLKRMRGADGKPTVCDKVWISYYTGSGESNGEGFGKLTAGYGSRQKPSEDGGKIGPEFTFGLTLDENLKEPVLIVKTAWGGKSLHTDFRSPSAGPYVLSEWQKQNYPKQEGHGIPKDFEKWKSDKIKETGVYYRLMIEHVKRVLADPKRVCPAYDPAAGYEIAGFVWLQGWNDMVDGHVYPNHNQPERYALYSDLLAHFIRDVRKDLNAPKMPFVIGVMGVGGLKNPSTDMAAFRQAMAAPADMPEFKGNVVAVQTAPFWSDELGAIEDKYGQVRQMNYFLDSKHKDHANADGSMTAEQKREYLKKFEAGLISPKEVALWKRGASNAGYHYLGCAKTFAQMGKAFADAILTMPEAGARNAVIDVRTILEQGRSSGKLPEGMVIRVAACLGEPKSEAADGFPPLLVEEWEFATDHVYRIDRSVEPQRTADRQVESRPYDSKEICKVLLDGKAIDIQARRGTGPEVLLVGSAYERGSRSIDMVWNGATILDLHETNGPILVRYPESDARAFAALYDKLANQARALFKAPSAQGE